MRWKRANCWCPGGATGEERFPDDGPLGFLPTGHTWAACSPECMVGNPSGDLLKSAREECILLLNTVLNINQANETKITKHNYWKGEINFHNMLMS